MQTGLVEEKLGSAHATAAAVAAEDGTLAVYLGGSLAAGLGNTRSDVDLLVITDHGQPPARAKVHTGGVRVDVQSYSADRFQDVVRTVTGGVPRRRLGELPGLETELEFATRLLQGQVHCERGIARDLRAELERRRSDVRRLAVARFTLLAASRYEDLLGCVESGDGETALMLSAEILTRALHVFLIGSDDLYVGEKWVWQKLRRTTTHLPADAIRDLYFAPAALPDRLVRRRMLTSQALLIAAQVNERRGTPGAWDGWQGEGAGGGPYERRLDGFPIVLDDTVLLDRFASEPEVMDLKELVLWGLCGGAAEDGIHRALAAPEFTGVSADEVRSTFKNLKEGRKLYVRNADS